MVVPVIQKTASRKTPAWGLLPVAALLGGMWAFGASSADFDWPALAAVGALVIGGWIPLWQAVARTDWVTPLSTWRAWEKRASIPKWPYLKPGTPGAALHQALSCAQSWWGVIGKQALAAPLQKALAALSLSFLISIFLGRTALLLTLMFVAWTQLAILWHENIGLHINGSAMMLVGLPWLLGATLGGTDLGMPALSGLALVLLARFFTQRSPLSIIGPILTAGFLVWQAHPMAAGWILLLAMPGMLSLLNNQDEERHQKTTFPWLLTMIFCVAGVL